MDLTFSGSESSLSPAQKDPDPELDPHWSRHQYLVPAPHTKRQKDPRIIQFKKSWHQGGVVLAAWHQVLVLATVSVDPDLRKIRA